MKNIVRKGLVVLLVALVVIQFIPVDRTNPATGGGIDLPEDLHATFKTACYDCHSNTTNWPWYSRIAPASFFIADHVHEAREEMNFSEWNQMSDKRRIHKLEEIWELVEAGEMPLTSYVLLHPEARLSEEQKLMIRDWVHSQLEQEEAEHEEEGEHEEGEHEEGEHEEERDEHEEEEEH